MSEVEHTAKDGGDEGCCVSSATASTNAELRCSVRSYVHLSDLLSSVLL